MATSYHLLRCGEKPVKITLDNEFFEGDFKKGQQILENYKKETETRNNFNFICNEIADFLLGEQEIYPCYALDSSMAIHLTQAYVENDENVNFFHRFNRKLVKKYYNTGVTVSGRSGSVLVNENNDFDARFSCRPNCNDQIGGPPFFSIILTLLICIPYFIFETSNNGDEAQKTFFHATKFSLPVMKNEILSGKWYCFHRFISNSLAYHPIDNQDEVLSNIIMVWLVCPFIEAYHDSIRPIIIYFLGILSGTLFSGSFYDPSGQMSGATAGIFALVMMHLMDVLINFPTMKLETTRFKINGLNFRLFAGIPLFYLMAGNFTHTFNFQRERFIAMENNFIDLQDDVDYDLTTRESSFGAIVGGIFTGVCLGILLVRNYRSRAWENVVMLFCFYLYVVVNLVLFVILIIRLKVSCFQLVDQVNDFYFLVDCEN